MHVRAVLLKHQSQKQMGDLNSSSVGAEGVRMWESVEQNVDE